MYGVETVMLLNNNVIPTKITEPITANGRAPILSKILPVIGDITPITIAPGNNSKPDSSGVKPLAVCI
ncbi:hypothetical protein D3C80_2243200 [compost metagenome]